MLYGFFMLCEGFLISKKDIPPWFIWGALLPQHVGREHTHDLPILMGYAIAFQVLYYVVIARLWAECCAR
jgi:hypothetical protein